ncbi:hypothetical protein CCICO_01150 [Corynebacterium ciconiae DSM 44920]|uniref:endonuclease/exonuclease/phosphatase family protein n=1 Tax=Corynebacterium ciconiae TaxID=227319 RepID=UPI00039F159A|nr:endonuclease/exonuclease/phosphatase family protein [Corynebacterium ciconiae]WKD60284.1 hypothetical protein CCICO_01150 [Corynebacterium ciconiae DSM 44920]
MRTARTVIVQLVLWALVAACGLLILFPHTAPARWLSTRMGVAQVLAFPYLVAGAGLVFALVLGIWGWMRRSAGWGCWSTAAAGCVAMVLALIMGLSPVPAPRGGEQARPAQPSPESITVVTFNSQNTLTASGFGELVDTIDPDIVVLPEAERHRVKVAVAGTEFEDAFIDPDPAGPPVLGPAATQVLVHPRLGTTRPADVPSFEVEAKAGIVTPPAAGEFRVAGVHPVPPMPQLVPAWREQTIAFMRYGEDVEEPVILAGDFNATLRHGPLAARERLTAASEVCSRRAVGTWPADAPVANAWHLHPLRTPIDHVFVSGEFRVVDCDTMPIGQADHLAFIARITRT